MYPLKYWLILELVIVIIMYRMSQKKLNLKVNVEYS